MVDLQSISIDNIAQLKKLVDDIADADTSVITQDIISDLIEAKQSEVYILPVAHHSVASAIKTQQILEKRKPSVIFVEMASDLQDLIQDIKECEPPVAFNAINYGIASLDPQKVSSFKAPLTDFSGEYQAILYGIKHKIPVIFVDLSCEARIVKMVELLDAKQKEFIVETGDIKPSRNEFVSTLVQNTSTNNFSEFWLNVMESSLLAANFGQYRLQMFFIGSLFRRLGHDHRESQLLDFRDQAMWKNISIYVNDHGINPNDTIFICGASHAVPVVKEFGRISNSTKQRVKTSKWHYGILNSSYAEIDQQFNEYPGTTAEKEKLWGTYKSVKPGSKITINNFSYDKLLPWAVDITKLARKHGYITSTADAIAIVDIYYKL